MTGDGNSGAGSYCLISDCEFGGVGVQSEVSRSAEEDQSSAEDGGSEHEDEEEDKEEEDEEEEEKEKEENVEPLSM